MKKLWLTYAWKDNEDKDIDFIIKELDKSEIEIKFDRRNLVPGQRLWQQIGGHITDPHECQAWSIILTKNSIDSEACIEELSYALDRVLSTNGKTFPIVALLHGISPSQLPPALKIRLCISLENNDNWVNQIIAAVNRTPTGYIPPSELLPIIFQEHATNKGYCLEIRPRFDRISPFAIAVNYEEKASGNVVNGDFGPAGIIPSGHVAFNWMEGENKLTDGTKCYIWGADNEINSTTSMYLFYKTKPKRIWFGHQKNLIKVEFS